MKTELIAFVVRELTYLKLLQPIISEVESMGCNYVLYNMDSPKGEKEYNRPTKARIDKSFGRDIRVSPFTTDQQLLSKLLSDKVNKIVSLEVGMWGKGYKTFFKANKIKTHSLLYLTDAMWHGRSVIEGFDRVYYTSKYLMNLQHRFNSIVFDPKRDRCLGSPIFDQLNDINNDNANGVLVMLPNQCDKSFFGGNERFCRMLEVFGKNLIFKSRKKQWLPEGIKKIAADIVFDGDYMYPSVISKLYPNTKTTILFYSSGVYEAVYGKQYVINIKFPLKFWRRDQNKMAEYFGGEAYNYDGVVESVSQDDVLAGKITAKRTTEDKRIKWIDKHIGTFSDKSYTLIARDIVE